MADEWHAEPPPNTRVIIVGRTGTGKSAALKTLFAERYPRVLVLDFNGTQWPRWKGARVVYSYPELVGRLRQLAQTRTRAYRVVCCFAQGSDDVTALFQLLTPDPRLDGGFPRASGGVTLLCDELSKVAGTGAPDAVVNAWSGGRHVGLTILGAAQRVSQVQRIVTASSEWIGVCQSHEPLDADILAQYLPPDAMGEVAKLPPFGLVLWNVAQGGGMVLHSPGKGVYRLARSLGPKIKPVSD